MKQTYQPAVKMAASAPKHIDDFEEHVVDGELRGTLSLTKVTEFWLAAVRTFGALHETSGTSVYSTEDIATPSPPPSNKHSCVNYFVNTFLDTEEFSPQRLFEEGDKGAHDLCCAVRRKMDGGPVINNWVKV